MLELYKNIKARRKELGLTQEELAKRMGYKDRSAISKIETGAVDLSQSKIMELATILKTDAGELMGWDDDLENKKTIQDELFQKRKLLFDMSAKASPEDLDKIIRIVDALVGEGFE